MSNISPIIDLTDLIPTVVVDILTTFDGTTSYYLTNEDGDILVSI